MVSADHHLTGDTLPRETSAAGANSHAKTTWLILLAILLVALALRLYKLGDSGFFVEELFSVQVATGTGDPELIQFDAIRPLYFWLLHGLMAIVGSNEFLLRLSTALFGLANVGLTYKLARMVFGAKAGLIAAFLTAVSPMELYYSQQVRMYAMGNTLTLCGTIAVLKLWQTSEKRFIWWWAALRYLTLLVLPLSATMILSDGIIALSNSTFRRSKLLLIFVVCAILVGACWMPFALQFIKLSTNAYGTWTQEIPNPILSDPLALLVNMTCTSYSLEECKGPPVHNWSTYAYVFLIPILLGMGIFASRKRRELLWCALWLFVPLTFLFLWSNLASTVFMPRYSLFTTPFLFVLIASGWCELWQGQRALAVLGAVIYTITLGCTVPYYYQNPMHEDWKQLADFILAEGKPGDHIAMWQYRAADMWTYYYHGPLPIHAVTISANLADDKPVIVHIDGMKHVTGRTWFISRVPPPDWPDQFALYERYKKTIAAHLRILQYTHLPCVDIFLAAPRTKPGATPPTDEPADRPTH